MVPLFSTQQRPSREAEQSETATGRVPYPAGAVSAPSATCQLGRVEKGPPKKPTTWGEIVFSFTDHAGALADRDSLSLRGAHGLCSSPGNSDIELPSVTNGAVTSHDSRPE